VQSEKLAIVDRLVEFFRRRGSRFLFEDSLSSTGWRELEAQEVAKKVQQSLRDAWKPSDNRPLAQSDVETGPIVKIGEPEMEEGAPWVLVPVSNHLPRPATLEYRDSDYLLGNHGGKDL
jgi:hypothetical protein